MPKDSQLSAIQNVTNMYFLIIIENVLCELSAAQQPRWHCVIQFVLNEISLYNVINCTTNMMGNTVCVSI